MEKGNFRKIGLDITAIKKQEDEAEEIEKLKQEAVKRLELFGFSTGFLDELKKDFKIKVADGITSRGTNKLEEETLKKIYLKLLNPKEFLPYYITEYWDCEKHYLAVLFVRHEQFDFFKRLIKSADCVRVIKCDITAPENITIDEDGLSLQDTLLIMKKTGDALYPIEAEKEIWETVNELYEERWRNKEYFCTRVYRSALTGEIIKTEPILPDKYEP